MRPTLTPRLAAALALSFACVALNGCATTPPGPLKESAHWKDVMRAGHLPDQGTLFIAAPTLQQPADLKLADAAPVSVGDDGSAYWPQELPAGFVDDLRHILQRNSGYEVTLWSKSGEEPAKTYDYEMQLRVTKLRFELVKVGMGSAMASLWVLAFPHFATYYNAPDEVFRCEYELEVSLTDTRKGEVVDRRVIRDSKKLSLTDFQRGWTLYSYWPEQTLRWLPEHDHVEAWLEYAPSVVAAVEPHTRREVLIEVMRFLREGYVTEIPNAESGYALVLGVDGPGAQHAEHDAAAVAEALLKTGLSTRSLLGDRATGDEAQRLLWERVARLKSGAPLILYFAGCGSGSEPGVLLSDRVCTLRQLVEPLRAARRRGAIPIAIFDAGLFGGGRCVEPAAVEALAELETELEGVTLWLASRTAQGASESADSRHGAFSTRFLQGLAGPADTNGDGLTLDELANFVSAGLPGSALVGPEPRSLVLAPPPGAARD